MLTTLKNWWKGYKFVELSNGKWLCFVRAQGLWQALATDPSNIRFNKWHMTEHIETYCLFDSEEEAVIAYVQYSHPTVNLHTEIKGHQ